MRQKRFWTLSARNMDISLTYTNLLLGGASIDVHGVPLTEETIEEARKLRCCSDGLDRRRCENLPVVQIRARIKRPEAGLLKIRKSLDLFANLRPAYLYQELKDACPLKEEIIGEGFDMLIMRELTGGLYFGERQHRRRERYQKSNGYPDLQRA